MILITEAESDLKSKVNSMDVKQVWETFKSFAKVPISGQREIELLVQWGVFSFTGEELFYLDFVRQFTVLEDEEYSHMEQLHCEFVFLPADELRSFDVSEWFFGQEEGLADFFNKIENLDEFRILVKKIHFD